VLGRPFERLLDVHRCGQLLSVDGKNTVAGLEVEAGLCERRFFVGIVVAAGINLRQAVAIVVDGIVGAEQAAGHAAGPRNSAAAAPKVAYRKLTQHFLKNVIEIGPGCD
jgi:hypothetical protein